MGVVEIMITRVAGASPLISNGNLFKGREQSDYSIFTGFNLGLKLRYNKRF